MCHGQNLVYYKKTIAGYSKRPVLTLQQQHFEAMLGLVSGDPLAIPEVWCEMYGCRHDNIPHNKQALQSFGSWITRSESLVISDLLQFVQLHPLAFSHLLCVHPLACYLAKNLAVCLFLDSKLR